MDDTKTFTFTKADLWEIFQEGRRVGEREATAFEWGCSPGGNAEIDFEDIINDLREKQNNAPRPS